jgi:mercuric ion binding protein
MKTRIGAGLISIIAGTGAALAATQTVRLAVDGMSCPSCPYQVEAALKKVDGVISARASLAEKSAVVTYDDAKTDVDALTKATANVGFPSSLAKPGN